MLYTNLRKQITIIDWISKQLNIWCSQKQQRQERVSNWGSKHTQYNWTPQYFKSYITCNVLKMLHCNKTMLWSIFHIPKHIISDFWLLHAHYSGGRNLCKWGCMLGLYATNQCTTATRMYKPTWLNTSI